MRMRWDKSKTKKFKEFINQNFTTDEAMAYFNTSRDSIRMQAWRIGAFIRDDRLYWKPDNVTPKVTIKTTLKDRVKTVLSEIENLQKEGAIFTMRDNKLVAMIDVNSL